MHTFIITYKKNTTFNDITAIQNYIINTLKGEAEFKESGVTECKIEWRTDQKSINNLTGKLNMVKNVVQGIKAAN